MKACKIIKTSFYVTNIAAGKRTKLTKIQNTTLWQEILKLDRTENVLH